MQRMDDVLTKLREICLALPDTRETVTWGHPAFRVADRMFCVYEEIGGKMTVGVKLDPVQADILREDPRIVRSNYFGRYKWVLFEAAAIEDWEEFSSLIMDAYRLAAPKRTLAKLDALPPQA